MTLTKKTREYLSTLNFSTGSILKIIRNLDPNKAHGHDMISIRMIEICDTSICRPLKLIFQSCLENGKFPIERKRANVVQVHKKGDKKILKNYGAISLLPTAGKIFERLLYDRMFEFFIEDKLISTNQSGFRPVIRVLINFSLSLMKFINLLMIALKSELHFHIYLKHLIRFGTKVSY